MLRYINFTPIRVFIRNVIKMMLLILILFVLFYGDQMLHYMEDKLEISLKKFSNPFLQNTSVPLGKPLPPKKILDKYKKVSLYRKIFKRFVNESETTFPYSFVINNENFCKGNNVFVLNFVHVRALDFESRSLIRSLWAAEPVSKATGIYVIFILGLPKKRDPELRQKIIEENEQHGDIIQGSFVDKYSHLGLKYLTGLKWAKDYCPNAQFVMRSDSDAFINPFTLTKFLLKRSSPSEIICRKMEGLANVCRKRTGKCQIAKWSVSWEEYPFDRYPPYCYGPLVIMNRNLSNAIYDASNKENPLKIDDAYFTGIVPLLLDFPVTIHDIYKHFTWRPEIIKKSLSSDLAIYGLTRYLGKSATMDLWKKILIRNKLHYEKYH